MERAVAFVEEHTDASGRGLLDLSTYETLTIEIKQLCQEEVNKQ